MSIDTSKIKDQARDGIAEALGDAYDCMRVWSAWGVGTMGPDDFALVVEDESRLEEITDAALAPVLSAIDAQAAEIAALRQPWQPIETAPKDGTWIVAWRGAAGTGHHDPMLIVRWHQFDTDDEGGWSWPDSPYDVWTDSGRQRADTHVEEGEAYFVEDSGGEPFTHWMPLPAPPVALSGESNGSN